MPQIKAQSIDTVVSTHVLCSVNSIADTLREINRILKPGGRFVFLEHTIADEGTKLRLVHENIYPLWDVLGDGCKFVDILAALSQQPFASQFDVESTQFDAPVPAFIKPHVRGIATKKNQ